MDGVLGTQTRGGRMEGAELWLHPNNKKVDQWHKAIPKAG